MDFNGPVQAAAQMQAEQLEKSRYGGLRGTLATTRDMPEETVGHFVNLMMSQSQELRERSTNIANQISGSYPKDESPSKSARWSGRSGVCRHMVNREGEIEEELKPRRRSIVAVDSARIAAMTPTVDRSILEPRRCGASASGEHEAEAVKTNIADGETIMSVFQTEGPRLIFKVCRHCRCLFVSTKKA